MKLTYVELFAGAGGMSLGLETAGWRCVAHAEIEPHARAVLRHHWPDVPLYGDVAELDGTRFRGVTMVTGGSPCQDLSIAGKRKGMTEGSGTRSSLFFEQVRIWNESEAPYILWENVYGAFSSNAGRDFAAVLSAIVGGAVPVPSDGWVRAGVVAGPTGVAAWRVLDAQYFGVPQRRRRVFVLGVREGGVDPAEVLSLAESLSGHFTASGEAREGVAADAGAGIEEPSGCLTPWDNQSKRVFGPDATWPTLYAAANSGQQQQSVLAMKAVNISDGRATLDDIMGTLDSDGASTTAIGAQTRGVIIPILEATARQGKNSVGSAGIGNNGDPMFTLTGKQHGVFTYEWHNQDSRIKPVDVAATLNLNAEGREGHLIYEQQAGIPRRLTPMECERLMGWPDEHTAHGISEAGKLYALADTARYKLCGNGIASPVTAWIGFQLRHYLTNV